MPWDEIVARQFPAFDKELDGISKQTMENTTSCTRGT